MTPTPSSSTQPDSDQRMIIAKYPTPSIIENITSSIPSFGTPPSAQSPTIPRTKKPWRSYLPSDPAISGALFGSAAVVLTLASVWGYRRYGRRIRNSDYVTSRMLERKVWIRGVVTSVGDGDNFRLFHTPLLYRFPFKFRAIPTTPKELKNETLHIRISGLDAPECAHFGNPAQPHSTESLEWLKSTLMGKRMRVQLLRKDQYNRIVGVPYISRYILRDRPLPIEMLKEGMAVVYTSGGGEYGPWGLDGMQVVEAEAKKAKRGLWALGKKFEHPADYKKRVKAGEDPIIVEEVVQATEGRGVWGMLRRLLGR